MPCPSPILNTNTPEAIEQNTCWWQNMVAGGLPFTAPNGNIYIGGTGITPAIDGCGRLKTDGTGEYAIDDYQDDIQGLAKCRIRQTIDAPILRVCGAHFFSHDPITFRNDSGGTTAAAIEIEGRTHPSTGRSSFSNITFDKFDKCFRALGGYYTYDEEGAETFVRDENHADNITVNLCHEFRGRCFFLSENEQALNWHFTDCGGWDLGGSPECIGADIVRGGLVDFTRWVGSHGKFTMFRVNWYNPNQNYLTSRDYHGDRMGDVVGWHFTPIAYDETPNRPSYYPDGPVVPGVDWQNVACDYHLYVEGYIASYATANDVIVANNIPANFPTTNLHVDIKYL